MSQKERCWTSPRKKLTCSKCGNKYWGECLVGMQNCFGCGKICHKVRDYPNIRGQDKGSGQVEASGTSFEAKKMNHFYALRPRDEKEKSPNVVKHMLQVFYIDVCALRDLDVNFSFNSPST